LCGWILIGHAKRNDKESENSYANEKKAQHLM